MVSFPLLTGKVRSILKNCLGKKDGPHPFHAKLEEGADKTGGH
jgi:hypothetical protein